MTYNPKYDKLLLGLISGVILPIVTLLLFCLFNSKSVDFVHYLKFVARMSLMSNVLSLCAIPNLIAFYFFINKELYKSTRGVIFATIIWGILVLITRTAS